MQSLRRQPRVGPIRLAPTATAAAVQCELPYGQQARGRPIHGRRESEDGGDGEPGPRLKIGAVWTRRLAVSEGRRQAGGQRVRQPAALHARERPGPCPSARPWSRGPMFPMPGAGASTTWRHQRPPADPHHPREREALPAHPPAPVDDTTKGSLQQPPETHGQRVATPNDADSVVAVIAFVVIRRAHGRADRGAPGTTCITEPRPMPYACTMSPHHRARGRRLTTSEPQHADHLQSHPRDRDPAA